MKLFNWVICGFVICIIGIQVSVAQSMNLEDNFSNNHQNAYENNHRRNEHLHEILSEWESLHPDPNSFSDINFAAKQAYQKAIKELNGMLSGQQKAEIKKAVFVTENAYFGNKKSYQEFCDKINWIVEYCKKLIKEKGLDYNNIDARNLSIHEYMADTTYLYSNGKIIFTHNPIAYDFEDYRGDKDWSKMFVTKLLNSNSGQCHSLPFLYRILSEEMKTTSYLSLAPDHIYIQFKDSKGTLFNFETTNGKLTTDSWIVSSGYIKSGAMKSRVFMDTLSVKQTISLCVSDLGKGYMMKFGVDDFVLQCAELALKYYPNNIYALMLKADILTHRFFTIHERYGKPQEEVMPFFPELKKAYDSMHSMYRIINNTGYEPIPKSHYEEWLQSANEEAIKQKHFEIKGEIKRNIPSLAKR